MDNTSPSSIYDHIVTVYALIDNGVDGRDRSRVHSLHSSMEAATGAKTPYLTVQPYGKGVKMGDHLVLIKGDVVVDGADEAGNQRFSKETQDRALAKLSAEERSALGLEPGAG